MPLQVVFAALQPLALSLGASQIVGHLAQRHASMVRAQIAAARQAGALLANRPAE